MATIAQLKRDHGFGLVKSARLYRIFDNILVEFAYQGQMSMQTLDDARTKKPRYFKSFDAAVRAVESVGLSVDALTVGGGQ